MECPNANQKPQPARADALIGTPFPVFCNQARVLIKFNTENGRPKEGQDVVYRFNKRLSVVRSHTVLV